jgi:nitrogen regulatory protein P-II 1
MAKAPVFVLHGCCAFFISGSNLIIQNAEAGNGVGFDSFETGIFYNTTNKEMGTVKKVELIIRPEKLEEVKEIFNELKIYGMTVAMVSGCGHQKGRREIYRGTEYSLNLLPKVKIETVVHDSVVSELIAKTTGRIKTGKVGDGKIFVYNVEESIKIRTGESGDDAI